MKTTKITFTDTYSGRSVSFRTQKNMVDIVNGLEDKYSWMSDGQRKKLESFFGKEMAYHTVMEVDQ